MQADLRGVCRSESFRGRLPLKAALNYGGGVFMYTRTELLIGKSNLEKLINSKVLIVGLGGVGGYVLEALVRAGVGELGLCDFDIIDVSNKNRQILALDSSIGKSKVTAAAERARDINRDCKLSLFDMKLDKSNISELSPMRWDYIAECIDDVDAKLALIKAAKASGTRILSSMGTGNKLNSDEFRICDIGRTENDRLARRVRRESRGEKLSFDVLFSKESPVQDFIDVIPSISYMPAAAGLRMAEHIIKKIIGF